MSAPTTASHVQAPPRRSMGLRALGLLGKLVALAGTAALTFQFGARGLAAGLLFGFVIPWFIALRPKRPIRRHPFRDGLHPLRWYPQLRPWAIVSGVIGGLGTVMVLQQFSIRAITNALLIRGLAGGLLGGVLIPSITWAFVVRRVNRGVRRATATPAAAMLMIAAWILVGMAGAALADVSGPCTATFQALDVSTLSPDDEADAFAVHPSDTATFTLAAPVPAVSSAFEIHYGPLSVPIDSTSGDSANVSVKVGDYDWAGAGLYLITGEAGLSDGTSCTGAILVDVQVDDPLRTVGGAVASTLASAGVLGVIGVALRNASDATKSLRLARSATDGAANAGAAIAAGTAASAAASRQEEPSPEPAPPPPPPAEVPPWPVTAGLQSEPESAGLATDEPPIATAEAGLAAGAAAAAAAARSPGDAEEDEPAGPVGRPGAGGPRGTGGEAPTGPRGATSAGPGGEPAAGQGGTDAAGTPDRPGSSRDAELGGDAPDVAPPPPEETLASEPGQPPFALREEVIERLVDTEAFEHGIPTGADDETEEARRDEDRPEEPSP